MTYFTLVLTLVVVQATVYVHGFSMGAPDVACNRMEPGHDFQPQTDDPPVQLSLDVSGEIQSGSEVKVTLSGDTFKGFIIQARKADTKDEEDSQIGFFTTDQANYITCFSGIHNTITHLNSNDKNKVEAVWKAPEDFEGEIVFRYSFVEVYDKYWVRIDTDPIKVVKRSAEIEGEDEIIFPGDFNQYGEVPVETEDFEDEADIDVTTAEISTTTATTTSTTTTISTTTTTTTTQEPILNYLPADHEIFEGCGDRKACFGMNDNDENCLGDTNDKCIGVVSYEISGNRWLFRMAGKTTGYLAVGLSYDTSMGDDLTAACYYFNGEVSAQAGYNVGKSNRPLAPSMLGIEDFKGSYEDGFLTCEFKRPMEIIVKDYGNKAFYLDQDQFVILLAKGPFGGGVLQYHDRKIKSSEPRALGIASNLAGASRLFIHLHGSFMIGAWIFSASVGMLLARYFKQTWTSYKCCKIDQWFIWHRNFMMVTWGLTIAGFVLIFLELDGWTSIPIKENPHSVLGCVTTGLCFIQPFIALLRCHPGTSKRPIFNWIHWFIGNSAQVVGIIAIFFAVKLGKANLPEVPTDYILAAFVAFHFVMHIILSLHQCFSDKRKENMTAYPMRPMKGHRRLYPDYEEVKRDAPGSGIRKFFLAVYIIVSALFAASLIILVIFGDFANLVN